MKNNEHLKQLEVRLDELLALCKQLHGENQRLRQENNSLLQERDGLAEKNKLARSRVEAMIDRIKALEAEV